MNGEIRVFREHMRGFLRQYRHDWEKAYKAKSRSVENSFYDHDELERAWKTVSTTLSRLMREQRHFNKVHKPRTS